MAGPYPHMMNKGFADVAGLLMSGHEGSASHWGFLAVGEGATAPAVSDCSLEHQCDRQPATQTWTDTSEASDTAQWYYNFSFAGGAKNVTEAGVFQSSVSGADEVMLSRATFTSVACGTADTLAITYKVQAVQG